MIVLFLQKGFMDPSNIMDQKNPKCYMRNQSFILYGSVFSFVIPLIIMKLMFSLTVRKLRMQIDKLAIDKTVVICMSAENKLNAAPNFLRRHKSSNGSSKKYKRDSTLPLGVSKTTESMKNEWKALKVLGIVFIAFIIAWLPLCLINIVSVVFKTSYFNRFLSSFTYLGYISSTFNPIIYTAFNKRFRKNFFEILRCSGKKKNNHFLTRRDEAFK